MKIPQYQVDAFTNQVFSGNPAAVCPVVNWLDDALLQAIAAENNLSETAFFVPQQHGQYQLRWFTPVAEVDLCGHATLAAAYVIFQVLGHAEKEVVFHTRSGALRVQQQGEWIQMDFPSSSAVPCVVPPALLQGLGMAPQAVYAAEDYLVVLQDETMVQQIAPDFTQLAQLDLRGVIVTAPGSQCDFVSRFFAPKFGIPEDPVTGSSHCQLAPYWAEQLDKTQLFARQLSNRGGQIRCELRGDRVLLSGQAVLFMTGEIYC